MGVVDRARKKLPVSGDYLDKDELIRDQNPMGIASCVFDPTHTYSGNAAPRWVLSVEPWFEDQEDPTGLVTFSSNPTRNPMFEDFQAQIEENHNEPIGPVVLVKEKSQKGFRFYTLADWSETPVSAPVPAPTATPTPARPRPQRPAAPAPDSVPTAVAPETVPANDAPTPKRRGRPRKTAETVAETPVSTPATKPAEGAAAASPAANVPLNVGSAICPDCHQEVKGRVLPDDQGRQFIIHPFCPALGKASVVEVVEATV
jgi:hypothetical protein